ncbi:MAG: hypothetical protein Q7Q71_09905 [Verrucomicrobiota bacterium JB023]|nr:hypothetical protein [Verrucomicrobiota bacterium JB023]
MSAPQDLPNEELQQLQSLLRLKNYERPVDGYFEDFLDEFHRRQREEVVSREPSVWEKVTTWFNGLGAARWAYGAGLGYALLFLAFVMWPDQAAPNQSVAQETEEVLPGDRRLEHVELERKQQPLPADEEKEARELLPKDF